MIKLSQDIWLQYGFKSNPYNTKALTSNLDALLPISEAIVGRSMKEVTSNMLTNILRGVGGGRVVCEGEIGIGKTTFVNYHRYLWENESEDKLFSPMSEITMQHHSTIKEFILTILSNFINKILILHGENIVMSNPLFKEIMALTRVFFVSTYEIPGQILGFGGGFGKSTSINVPFVSTAQLIFYLEECVKTILKLGYKGIFLHFDNLELLNQNNTDKTKDIRDAVPTNRIKSQQL